MARLIRPLRKCLQLSSSSSSHKALIWQSHFQNPITFPPENPYVFLKTLRHYISDMRRSAFEGNILRLLRNEIRYELDRSPPVQVCFSVLPSAAERNMKSKKLQKKFILVSVGFSQFFHVCIVALLLAWKSFLRFIIACMDGFCPRSFVLQHAKIFTNDYKIGHRCVLVGCSTAVLEGMSSSIEEEFRFE